ncbi:hypothetical protein MASR2M18_13900 [Ignavibacteria bacterium]
MEKSDIIATEIKLERIYEMLTLENRMQYLEYHRNFILFDLNRYNNKINKKNRQCKCNGELLLHKKDKKMTAKINIVANVIPNI